MMDMNALVCPRTLNFGHTTVHRRVTASNETIREYYIAMFILLLLLSRAGCDWVEISQNHYRKEPIHKVVNFEHTTKPNRIYRNNSVTQEQWHRGAVDKVSSVASIRRVQYPSVKTNSLKTRHEDRFNFHNEHNIDTTEAEYDYLTIKPNIQKFHAYYDEDEDVIENQSRVNVIRTSTANIGNGKHPNSKPTTIFQGGSIDRRKHYGENQHEDVNHILNTNQRNHMQISKPLIEKLNLNEHDKFYTLERPNLHRVSLGDELNSSAPKESDNRYSNYSITKRPNISKIKLFQIEDNDKVKQNDYSPHITGSHPLEEYFESRNKLKNPTGHIDNNKNAGKINEQDPKIPIQSAHNSMELTPSIDNKETTPNAEDLGLKHMKATKVNPMKGMWKLLKVVANTIYKNTHRSFKSKITYLEGLKATILTSIEDQIDSAWPDDASGAPSRHRRAAQSRGHVEFPSSESTLMTISFLTFAVFLIKLVLQVIHTYKNKTMMLTPTIVSAVGRAAAAFRTTS